MADHEPGADLVIGTQALEQARGRRVELGKAAKALEEALARPGGDPEWTLRVASGMQDLGLAFQAHCRDVEAEDGLLPELLRHAPRLSDKIAAIEGEHATIGTAITSAVQLIGACEGDCGADAVESIREATVEVLRAISRHRQRGADLVYEAYEVDIGGGG